MEFHKELKLHWITKIITELHIELPFAFCNQTYEKSDKLRAEIFIIYFIKSLSVC